MKAFLGVLGVIGVIVLMIVIAFALELGGLQWKKFFAPKHAAVERQVFKETRSYNEAKTQDLAKYRLEYLRSSDVAEKEALAATIRTMFADYDRDRLPNDLGDFLLEIRGY